MTESISSDIEPVQNTLTTKNILDVVGYALLVTTFLLGLYSGVFSPENEALEERMQFGWERFAAMAGMVIAFLAASRSRSDAEKIMKSTGARVGFLLLFLLLPCLSLAQHLSGLVLLFPIQIAVWALWGAGCGYFFCLHIESIRQSSSTVVVPLVYFGFLAGSVLATLLLAMDHTTRNVAIVAMIVAEFALLIVALRRVERPLETDAEAIEAANDTNEEPFKFRANGSYVMVVDGMLLSWTGFFLLFQLHDAGISPTVFGFAFIATCVLFWLLKAFAPRYLSLEYAQLLFVPVLVCGALFIGFAGMPWRVVFTFVLFAVLMLFDLSNSAVLALRCSVLDVSAGYCYAKGRVFWTVGQMLGWLLAVFASTEIGYSHLNYILIALVGLQVLYFSICSINPEMFPLAVENADGAFNAESALAASVDNNDAEQEPARIERPFKHKCAVAAAKYGMTTREGEILFYLAKGRNAKYIADQLFIAERTIKTHTYHIYQKMEIHSQPELMDIVENIELDQ